MVIARRLDMLSREFIISQADLDPGEVVRVALPVQRLIMHLPQSHLGFGVVSYEDRVQAGSFAKSVTGMLRLLSELQCPWLQDAIKQWMTVNSRRTVVPADGSLNHGYRQVIAKRKVFFAANRDAGTVAVKCAQLPSTPAMLNIKGEVPSSRCTMIC